MRTCVLTTCVGRWRFLEQSYATWCRNFNIGVVHEVLCVTSGQCTDVTGVKAQKLGMQVINVRLEEDELGRPIFHKTRMLNEGAAWAKEHGYERLLLLDADTMVLGGFTEELAAVPDGYFAFCKSPLTKRDLAGVLLVNLEDWLRVGGMDERMVGWGAEDLDMRLRLWGERNLPYKRLDPTTLQSISHSDDLRVELRSERNKHLSLAWNNFMMAESYYQRTGRHLTADLPDVVELQEMMGLVDELKQRGASLGRPTQH